MTKYPTKKSAVYTANLGLRVEPELLQEFHAFKRTSKTDIPEAMRMALRALAKELREKEEKAS